MSCNQLISTALTGVNKSLDEISKKLSIKFEG